MDTPVPASALTERVEPAVPVSNAEGFGGLELQAEAQTKKGSIRVAAWGLTAGMLLAGGCLGFMLYTGDLVRNPQHLVICLMLCFAVGGLASSAVTAGRVGDLREHINDYRREIARMAKEKARFESLFLAQRRSSDPPGSGSRPSSVSSASKKGGKKR
jgi:hypothetical protein